MGGRGERREVISQLSALIPSQAHVMFPRYVLELRSLVTLYVLPLLHPLVAPPSTPPITASPSPSLLPAVSTTSRTELPIAARFLRAVSGGSEDARPSHWDREMPEIGGSDSSHLNSMGGIDRSRTSLPARPRDTISPSFPSSNSTISLALSPREPPHSSTGRLSSSLPFRHRHPLRPAPSSTKLHKSSSRAPLEAVAPPTLPDGLRRALEVMPDMLAGHEELSARLCVSFSPRPISRMSLTLHPFRKTRAVGQSFSACAGTCRHLERPALVPRRLRQVHPLARGSSRDHRPLSPFNSESLISQ